MHVCRPPSIGHKQYNDDCSSSSECDITRGLCCIMQRRHRQKARKVGTPCSRPFQKNPEALNKEFLVKHWRTLVEKLTEGQEGRSYIFQSFLEESRSTLQRKFLCQQVRGHLRTVVQTHTVRKVRSSMFLDLPRRIQKRFTKKVPHPASAITLQDWCIM